jgi:hypothetical protein
MRADRERAAFARADTFIFEMRLQKRDCSVFERDPVFFQVSIRLALIPFKFCELRDPNYFHFSPRWIVREQGGA